MRHIWDNKWSVFLIYRLVDNLRSRTSFMFNKYCAMYSSSNISCCFILQTYFSITWSGHRQTGVTHKVWMFNILILMVTQLVKLYSYFGWPGTDICKIYNAVQISVVVVVVAVSFEVCNATRESYILHQDIHELSYPSGPGSKPD